MGRHYGIFLRTRALRVGRPFMGRHYGIFLRTRALRVGRPFMGRHYGIFLRTRALRVGRPFMGRHHGIFLRRVARLTPSISDTFTWFPLVIVSASWTSVASTTSTMSWNAEDAGDGDIASSRSCSAFVTAFRSSASVSSRGGRRDSDNVLPISSTVITSPRARMHARLMTV